MDPQVDIGMKSKDAAAIGNAISEGKVEILHDPKNPIFYNPTQEVNRDLSVLGIQTFIQAQPQSSGTAKVSILEAMAACGIRSIRYAKEIKGIDSIIANDFSEVAVASITTNSEHNNTFEIVIPSCSDASTLMHSQKSTGHLVIDIDPYGSPVPFLDSAIQCVRDGGMLLVTATDMAILAGNHPESCFAKYGSMSMRSSACHELALRILIFTVQSTANRYGRVAEPLISLSIDFYVRIFFRINKSALKAKASASQTSLVFQCTGCRSFNMQPLSVSRGNGNYGLANGPTVSQLCDICNSRYQIGGPIWTGPLHDNTFISAMLGNLKTTHAYLKTSPRIEGLLNVAMEELQVPLFYEISQLCSVVKCPAVPLLEFRSALMTLGYEVSGSHAAPNSLKTNAPNNVLWDILREWHVKIKGGTPKDGTPASHILAQPPQTKGISFEIREDANPASRANRFLRFQMNPTKNWGPGSRDAFKIHSSDSIDKKVKNQGKNKANGKRKYNAGKSDTNEESKMDTNDDTPEVKTPKNSS